jgi:hypothetical protein
MDGRVIKLAFLSLLSAALCVIALIYDTFIATTVFAGLTFGTHTPAPTCKPSQLRA